MLVLALLAGCGKSEQQAPQRPPAPVSVMTVDAADDPLHPELRRPDRKLAAGRHRRARVGLPGQDRLPGGRAGQGRPGAVPARSQAVPGAAAGRAGRAAVAAGALDHGAAPTSHASSRWPSRMRCRSPTWTGPGRVRRGQSGGVLARRPRSTKPQLNLGYTTIRSPVTGLASRSQQRQGAFINAMAAERAAHVRGRHRSDLGQLQHLAEPDRELSGADRDGAGGASAEQRLQRGDRAARRRRSSRRPARSTSPIPPSAWTPAPSWCGR